MAIMQEQSLLARAIFLSGKATLFGKKMAKTIFLAQKCVRSLVKYVLCRLILTLTFSPISMKYCITLIISFFLSSWLAAQAPANDECSTATDLGVAPFCDASMVFSNVDATDSNIGDFNVPSCYANGVVNRDVWFSFTPSDTISDYRISITGNSNGQAAIANPQLTIYRGLCIENGLAELICADAEPGSSEVSVDLFQLTFGVTYYLRVSDASPTATPNAGGFNVCIEQRPPINLVSEGGSTQCSGLLYDSGGPDGNYGNNEDFTYVICPNQPNNCINFTFTYYNLEYQGGEIITIFDGDNSNPGTPVLATIGGFDTGDGGAVCFQTAASSGCITIRFQSDATVNMEGFEASWECSVFPCEEILPITVDIDVTETQIANAIRAAETTLSVVDINCPPGAIGIFTADNSDLGLGQGIILATGDADYAIGPNTSAGAGGGGFGGPGDADLDSLSVLFGDGNPSFDACVLELDVFANTDELVFEYVFGSEEYPEFVNSFNDIFAFLISGPGIEGLPQLNNQRNIAVLPNASQTIVQIDSVNNGVNYQYYRNNELGQSVEYDGLTSDFLGQKKSLTARADVIPCNTYRLKLAIADRQDNVWDSGVFISDIRGGAPEAFVDFASGIDYLVEDCVNVADTLVVQLFNNQDSIIRYQVQVLGSATPNEDYIIDGLPEIIEFAPGENEFRFPITVLSDLIDEGEEDILINFVIDFGCGATIVSSLTIPLRDRLEVNINAGRDTVVYCVGEGIGLIADGAATYSWAPAEIFDNPFEATVFATPTGSTTVQVVGALGNCTDTAFVLLQEVDPIINILNGDSLSLCRGDTIQLLQTNNLEDSNITWSPTFGIVNGANTPNPLIAPLFNTNYVVQVELEGCVVSDTIAVDVDLLAVPTLIGDTTICESYPIQPATVFDFQGQTTYSWMPEEDFVDPTDPESILNPVLSSQEYTLISSSLNGACADTQSVVISVIPSRIRILNPDTVEVCAGFDPIILQAAVSPEGGSPITWSPQGGAQSPNTGPNYIVQPGISVRYFARYTVNNCPQIDSVLVKVDSLPRMDITADPFKDPYCQGDTFFLRSPIYDVGDFPGIEHRWFDALGIQTGDSLYNAYVIAQDTSLFFRVTNNGACVDTSSIQINVVTPPPYTLTPLDTSICPGGSVQYEFMFLDGAMGSLEWMGGEGSLSCTDCFTPLATPTQSTTYSIEITAEGSDCTFPLQARINLIPAPNPLVSGDRLICQGESLQMLLSPRETGVVYRLTGGGLDTDDPFTILTPTAETTYTLTATNACTTVVRTATIRVANIIDLELEGPQEVCVGDLVSFESNAAVPEGITESFSWFVNGSFRSNNPTYSFEATQPGNFNIRLTYVNDCQTSTVNATVMVRPAPSLEVTPVRTICQGESVVLNLAPDATTTGYVWSGTDGSSSTLAAPTVSPAQTTTYTVTASSNDVCDPITQSFTIEVIEPYTLAVDPEQFICFEGSTTINANVSPAGTNGIFSWSGPGIVAENGNQITVMPFETSSYTVSFLDAAGCFAASTATTVVGVYDSLPTPVIGVSFADGTPVDSTVFGGSDLVLTASAPPAGFTYTYTWSSSAGNGEGQVFQSTVPNTTGDIIYTLTVSSEPGGCVATASVTVSVVMADYKIPNLISPNRDGINDGFRVFYNGALDDYQLIIFNRWGQQVFSSSNPEEVWDGRRDGVDQPMDVYLYRVRFRQNGMDVSEDGEFTLVR